MLDFLNYSKLLNVQHTWLLYGDCGNSHVYCTRTLERVPDRKTRVQGQLGVCREFVANLDYMKLSLNE